MPATTEQVQDLEKQEAFLNSRKDELDNKITLLSKEIALLKATASNKEDEREKVYYEENKHKYDVDLKDLVVVGKVSTLIKVGDIFEFQIQNLRKSDSLEIDKLVKSYAGESNVYVDNKVRVDILTKALVAYGCPGSIIRVPEDHKAAVEAVSSINEECLAIIWEEYTLFNRWVQCALRAQLKNSSRLQRSGSR
jgi:hypothetical protein